MWPMIAEPGLTCLECRHTIQQGRLCLSELPEETPPNVSRQDFKNYCIGCPECWAQGRHACYGRNIEARKPVPVPRNLPCARCGVKIEAGRKAPADIYFEWPEAIDESMKRRRAPDIGAVSTATGLETLIKGIPPNSFENLGESLQRKFATAGLGGDRGIRPAVEAQSFYADSIPYAIRNLGPQAVRDYVSGKDASHIQSVQNAPHLARENSNIFWENREINNARGSGDMSRLHQMQGHATNAFDATTIIFRDCLDSASIAALYAALLEAPVTTVENYFHYQKGRKTGEEAIKDAAESIANKMIVAGAVVFTVTAATILIPGTGTLLITIAPYLVPIGMTLYAYASLKRITKAMERDLPLHQVGTFFCSTRCHTRFAYETGHSALMRRDTNRTRANAGETSK